MKFKIESLKNRIKSNMCELIKKIEIIHRLDYDKYPIYLHDNIRLASCRKEPGTVGWIEEFSKDDTVFDIGANVGAYSLIMSKFAKKVYAFEPSVFNFNVLIKNVYTNKAPNIVPLNIALSQYRKLGTFVYSSTETGGSGHSFGQSPVGGAYKQEIISCSIDEFVEDFKIEAPNHIKLDVDGIEYEILKGATETLSRKTFKSLMVEVDEKQEEMFGFLEKLNLRKRERHYVGPDGIYNYLFTK